MKNILTIYKIKPPFGEASLYDRTKYNTICDELEWFLKYSELYISEERKKYSEFEVLTILFKWWKIKIIFYFEREHVFLPSFQVDLFVEKILDMDFLHWFYKIFTSLESDSYIFDLITPKLTTADDRIIIDEVLAENFKSFNEKKLEKFLINIDIFFIEEKLEQHAEFKYHLYYLIFLNYKLFKNILLSSGWILKLEKLLWEDIDDSFISELSFSKERIEHISEINIMVFKKYKDMLESFIWLLKV